MKKVVGVRFKTAGKVYHFDPGKFELNIGDEVVVETIRGVEFGTVTCDKEIDEENISIPLKQVIRLADDEDRRVHKENIEKKEKALEMCQEKVDKHKLDMRLIDVEYTFDNSKIIFYFTSDGRVDFRELVKDLAAIFKMRIELRQIGVRDEAKMLGGIGSCGKPLCCHSWLSEFQPVSIKMAKVQNLSLNPSKISGICGRLMCCLKYENDVYLELRRGIPEIGENIRTPKGIGKVVEANIFENKIRVRMYLDEKDTTGDGYLKYIDVNTEAKLSDDIYSYTKEEIKRIEKRKQDKDDVLDDVDDATLEEIKELIKD